MYGRPPISKPFKTFLKAAAEKDWRGLPGSARLSTVFIPFFYPAAATKASAASPYLSQRPFVVFSNGFESIERYVFADRISREHLPVRRDVHTRRQSLYGAYRKA